MRKITKKAIVIAIIAGLLVLCDGLISKLLNQNASFTWVAFISWTVFFGANVKERLNAIVGYIIGFFAGVAIIYIGNWLSFIPINIFSVAFSSILATMIIDFVLIEFENFRKIFSISFNGVFVGISMVFSGLGIGLTVDTLNNSLLMLIIIVLYGILGLLCGWATLKFSTDN